LVREHYIDKCSHQAAALYLFLVTVSDIEGLSYYSEASIMKRLSMDNCALNQARLNLIHLGLIAYKKPLYQVLALDGSLTSTVKTAVLQDSFPAKTIEDSGVKESLNETAPQDILSLQDTDTRSPYKPAGEPLRKIDTSRIDGLKSIKEILKKITEEQA
jgi:hypothetical protein